MQNTVISGMWESTPAMKLCASGESAPSAWGRNRLRPARLREKLMWKPLPFSSGRGLGPMSA